MLKKSSLILLNLLIGSNEKLQSKIDHLSTKEGHLKSLTPLKPVDTNKTESECHLSKEIGKPILPSSIKGLNRTLGYVYGIGRYATSGGSPREKAKGMENLLEELSTDTSNYYHNASLIILLLEKAACSNVSPHGGSYYFESCSMASGKLSGLAELAQVKLAAGEFICAKKYMKAACEGAKVIARALILPPASGPKFEEFEAIGDSIRALLKTAA